MNPISEFCENKGISPKIEELFDMFCRSTYATRFSMRNGDTVAMIVRRMSPDQVEDAWQEFVSEIKHVILSAEDHGVQAPLG